MTINHDIDRICDSFESAWKSGERPRIDVYLSRASASDRSCLLENLINIEIEFRLRHESVSSQDYACLGNDAIGLAAAALERFQKQSKSADDDDPGSGWLDETSTRSLAEFLSEAEGFERFVKARSRHESSPMIGPYKLLQQIGRGGMGTVFMAEQMQPVRRRVALKLIKAGMDSKELIARFEAERQALALMDHPNIAKVLDAGTTPGGLPYFVMELVRGIPLTTYCDDHKLSIDARLNLFVQTCRAIQHAHQKGIIHRDIKPRNVLVTQHDGVPAVKVIDFGLAKALQSSTRLTDQTLFTEFGQVIGTYQYMSPEQAEMNALDVDTRTDVYSLGVLLYELLTGTTPIDSNELKTMAVDRILLAIREQDAPRPSIRLSSLGTQATTVSDQRMTDTRTLGVALKGDLDWIAMKALEKDRTRRYESPAHFADDVLRYLAQDSVTARPPTFSYRFRKTLHKHRVAASVLVMFFALITVSLTTSTLLWWKTHQQAKIDRQNEQAARRALLIAEEASIESAAAARRAVDAEAVASQRAAEAQRARNSAVEQQQLAEARLESLAWQKYASTLQFAYAEWQGGRALSALALLDSCEGRLRGPEHTLLHSLISRQWTRIPENATVSPDGRYSIRWVDRDDIESGVIQGDYSRMCAELSTTSGDTYFLLFPELDQLQPGVFGNDGFVFSGNSSIMFSRRIFRRGFEATFYTELRAISLQDDKVIGHVFEGNIRALAVSHSGDIVCFHLGSTFWVWDVEADTLAMQDVGEPIEHIAICDDGSEVLVYLRSPNLNQDPVPRTWQGDFDQRLFRLELWRTQPIRRITRTPGLATNATMHKAIGDMHATVVLVKEDGVLTTWSASGSDEITATARHRAVSCIDVSSDGTRIAVGDRSGTIRIYRGGDLTITGTFTPHRLGVSTVQFLRGSTQILSGGFEGDYTLSDTETGRVLQRLSFDQGDHIRPGKLAILDDETRVHIAGGLVTLLGDSDKLNLSAFPSATEDGSARVAIPVSALAVSRDSRKIAVRTMDGKVSVYGFDGTALSLMLSFDTGLRSWPDRLAFSPESDTLIIASGASIHTYQLDERRHIASRVLPNSIERLSVEADGKHLVVVDSDHIRHCLRLSTLADATNAPVVLSTPIGPVGGQVAVETDKSQGVEEWASRDFGVRSVLTTRTIDADRTVLGLGVGFMYGNGERFGHLGQIRFVQSAEMQELLTISHVPDGDSRRLSTVSSMVADEEERLIVTGEYNGRFSVWPLKATPAAAVPELLPERLIRSAGNELPPPSNWRVRPRGTH